MLVVVLACLTACALAAPKNYRHQDGGGRPDHRHFAILRDEREDRGDGNFRYEFETENGIRVNAVGTPGSKGQSNIQGSYRFSQDDGTVVVVTYVADVLGYRPQFQLIDVPLRPAPPATLRPAIPLGALRRKAVALRTIFPENDLGIVYQ